MKILLRHASSFIAPVVMCLIIPYILIRLGGHTLVENLEHASALRIIAGGVITAVGLALFILTVHMFIRTGKGTIMPWDPTRKLITVSLYGYVRNPMILSLMIVLIGEAILFASWLIALLALVNWAVNSLYFRYSEEPGLERRFGSEYREYKQRVSGWIPRRKPWKPTRRG